MNGSEANEVLAKQVSTTLSPQTSPVEQASPSAVNTASSSTGSDDGQTTTTTTTTAAPATVSTEPGVQIADQSNNESQKRSPQEHISHMQQQPLEQFVQQQPSQQQQQQQLQQPQQNVTAPQPTLQQQSLSQQQPQLQQQTTTITTTTTVAAAPPQVRTIAKLPSTAGITTTSTNLPKASLITVLNTPLGNVKTLCVTPAVSANTSGQFTVVNSSSSVVASSLMNVANPVIAKPPQTITLINTPVTVVKTIPPNAVDNNSNGKNVEQHQTVAAVTSAATNHNIQNNNINSSSSNMSGNVAPVLVNSCSSNVATISSTISTAPETIAAGSSPLTIAPGATTTLPGTSLPLPQYQSLTQQLQPPPPMLVENRGHNVFVKNTTITSCPQQQLPQEGNGCGAGVGLVGSTSGQQQQQHHLQQQQLQDMVPQSHKLLTANNFPTNNVLATSINNMGNINNPKTANGQRNKVKILSDVCLPGTSQTMPGNNALLNKTAPNPPPIPSQRYLPPRQKLLPPPPNNNGSTCTAAKYLNRPPPTHPMNKSNMNPLNKQQTAAVLPPQQKMIYPTHKSQIKTLPPTANNYLHGSSKPPGIKTLPPQHPKGIPGGQVQKTGLGLRTIPPQRPQKMPNKPNYIGKHAAQAQKQKATHKLKNMRPNNPYGNYHQFSGAYLDNKQQQQQYQQQQHHQPQQQQHQQQPPQSHQMISFNQALTAQILASLGSNSSDNNMENQDVKGYELPPRYDNSYYTSEPKPIMYEQNKFQEERTKSGLDLIYQAVLLDHNYNATPPPDSPTRPIIPPPSAPSQLNGVSMNSMYSPPGSGKRRTLSQNSLSATTSLTNLSSAPSNSTSLIGLHDDDAASDISDVSDRKHDTEGEETDTAPEAEAVSEDPFGDYVTRCICSDTDGEETDTAPEAEAVNEDPYADYVTRCICGFVHDDGYMVECDRCKVWQHVQCVVKNRQVPDEYLCEVCDPHKPIDRQKARTIQQQWIRDRQQLTDPKLRKDMKLKEVVMKRKDATTDTDTSDGEHAAGPNNHNMMNKSRPAPVNRRKSDGHQKANSVKQRRDQSKETAQRKPVKKRERKIVKRKTKAQLKSHSDDDHPETSASNTTTTTTSSTRERDLPQLRQWIENYEEAVTNHYSPELRYRIGSIRVNGAHSDFSTMCDSTVNKCRVHTQPLTELKYLVSTVHLPPNTPVIELRGKYMLSNQHNKNNSSGGGGGNSLNTRQHTQRPGPFLFFYRLHRDNTEVCVDTRTYGNSARFIRRSCKPNAELRHSIVKGVLHLYIVTIADVDKNVELTIKHESHDLAAIGTTHISCACGNEQECTVNRTPTTTTTGASAKKNGEANEIQKKRRGRRTASLPLPSKSASSPHLPASKSKKESPVASSPLSSPTAPPVAAAASAAAPTHNPSRTPPTPSPPPSPAPLSPPMGVIKQEEIDLKEEADTIKMEMEEMRTKVENMKKEESSSEEKKAVVEGADDSEKVDIVKTEIKQEEGGDEEQEHPSVKADVKEAESKTASSKTKSDDATAVATTDAAATSPTVTITTTASSSSTASSTTTNSTASDTTAATTTVTSSKPSTPTNVTSPISTRRSSSHHNKVDKEETKQSESKDDLSTTSTASSDGATPVKKAKLSREERKLEAILRAIEQMEKADQRKQEHQAKQVHRRESEPGPGKEEEKPENKIKRKRRKGRARTNSILQGNRRSRYDSTDSCRTSGDETLMSPNDNSSRPAADLSDSKENNSGEPQSISDKDAGLLLAFSNTENKVNKSPIRESIDSNSNSAQSSPETQLSSACLLVQAAVEPMDVSFKFPKTKKHLMNEWFNKTPEPVQSTSSISSHINTAAMEYESNNSSSFYNNNNTTPPSVGSNCVKNLTTTLAQNALSSNYCDNNLLQVKGNAKKRWLRQAISEDQCDSPSSSRPESPPISEMVAPPKKRRAPRESLSNNASPPTTPTSLVLPPINFDRQQQQQQQPITTTTTATSTLATSVEGEGIVHHNNNNSNNASAAVGGCGDDNNNNNNNTSPAHQPPAALPQSSLESDALLEDRTTAEMKEDFGNRLMMPSLHPTQLQQGTAAGGGGGGTISNMLSSSGGLVGGGCLMDPRLTRATVAAAATGSGAAGPGPGGGVTTNDHFSLRHNHHHHHHHHHHGLFSNSDHLVGTVEKTLSIFGFDDNNSRKPEAITPTKRKLSITEYRQRKKLNNNDKTIEEQICTEENTSESFKPSRPRSNSTSSCTSLTSSDDEMLPLELTGKAPSAFNSEPTELERQREITSLRLKKAFGIAVDDEMRKPALDVDTILNCEIPTLTTKTMPPSPNFPIPGSSSTCTAAEVNLSSNHQQKQQTALAAATLPLIVAPKTLQSLTQSPGSSMDGSTANNHLSSSVGSTHTNNNDIITSNASNNSIINHPTLLLHNNNNNKNDLQQKLSSPAQQEHHNNSNDDDDSGNLQQHDDSVMTIRQKSSTKIQHSPDVDVDDIGTSIESSKSGVVVASGDKNSDVIGPAECASVSVVAPLKPTLFYTPDEEERSGSGSTTVVDVPTTQDGAAVTAAAVEESRGYEDVGSVDYVPPFNNPIYPSNSNFTTYSSVIDDEGRYEGRNPSPPPDMERSGETSPTFPGHQA